MLRQGREETEGKRFSLMRPTEEKGSPLLRLFVAHIFKATDCTASELVEPRQPIS